MFQPSQASWMETQPKEALAEWQDPESSFGVELAKVKFNAATALDKFTTSQTK